MVSLLLCVQFASCKNIRVEAHELDQTDIRNHFLQDSMRRGQLSPSIMTFTIQVTAAQTNASAVLAGYLSDSSSAAQLRDALGNVLSELLSVTNGSAAVLAVRSAASAYAFAVALSIPPGRDPTRLADAAAAAVAQGGPSGLAARLSRLLPLHLRRVLGCSERGRKGQERQRYSK